MAWILRLANGIVFFILYANFKGAAQTLIVMTSVPFAAVGAVWTLWLARFNTSIAVWVGMIALPGVAAETACVIVVYLDQAWKHGREDGTICPLAELLAEWLEDRKQAKNAVWCRRGQAHRCTDVRRPRFSDDPYAARDPSRVRCLARVAAADRRTL